MHIVIMEKKMKAIIHRDNGKEHGIQNLGFRVWDLDFGHS